MKPPKKFNPTSDLKAKLKASEPEVQNYVTALKSENLKLHRQIAKLQAKEVSLLNRIKVIKKEYTKKQEVTWNIVTNHDKSPK